MQRSSRLETSLLAYYCLLVAPTSLPSGQVACVARHLAGLVVGCCGRDDLDLVFQAMDSDFLVPY